jgi:branched-chain amino acid transport system ATP-binding protein
VSAPANLLAITDLTVRYGHAVALDGVGITVGAGEVVAVIGPNGAGKTTLLRTMSGLVSPRGGSIRLDSRELVGTAPYKIARLGLAHVPEGRGTLSSLTVEENLRLGGRGLPAGEVRSRVEQMYDVFPVLGRLRTRRGGLLSGGEQQMLVVARGLMPKPKLLAIDEPSMGLAPIMILELVQMLRTAASTGVAIMLVEQNSALAAQLADRVYVLVRGTVRAETDRGNLPTDLLEEFLA